MIVTVTPNAALDRSLVVPGYAAGGVFRPQRTLAIAGGKGVNVARAARILGGQPRCHGFLAGHTGALVAELAATEGLDCRWTRLASGETRVCTAFIDPDTGMTTIVNESGVKTSNEDWDNLRNDIFQSVEQSKPSAICFCGSLPPGASTKIFRELLGALIDRNQSIWVDTSGAALKAAAYLRKVGLKINQDEAAELLNRPIGDISDAAPAARELAGYYGSAVITLGERGALFSDGDSVWLAQPPPIHAQSAVGSGDSFLAGLLVALGAGQSQADALRSAVAAGTANALSVGAGQFTREDYEQAYAETNVTRVSR